MAGFCAFLFFYGLGSFGLVGADEPRYAQIAREMLARHDWITPTLNGTPWLEKPILYYWGAMLSYGAFGVSDWAARVPSAVAATAMVAAIYVFMRHFRPGSQLDAALIAASMAGTIGYARAASTDMPLTASLVAGMLSWYAWRSTGHRRWLALFYALMALGTLAKGPVAPFLAALIVIAFALLRREGRLLGRSLWWPTILLYCALALPWYVAVQLRTGDFFQVFILQHNLDRFTTDMFRHRQPFWYYLPVLLVGLLPWTVYEVAAIVDGLRRWRKGGDPGLAPVGEEDRTAAGAQDFRAFLLLWAAVPVIFFTFSESKLPGYILPSLIPLALLLADWVYEKKASEERGGLGLMLGHAAVAGAMLGAVLLAPTLVARGKPSGVALWVAGVTALAIFGAITVSVSTQGLRWLRFVTLVPVLLGLAFLLRIGAPTLDSSLSARPIAAEIARLQTRPTPLAVFRVRREVEYGLNFYRDQKTESYDRGEIPAVDHLVVAQGGSLAEVQKAVAGRRVSYVGGFAPQGLDFYWISPGMSMMPGMPMGHEHDH